MNYYRRYVGSYLKKTSKLSLRDHGAYSILLDYYYAEEKPLPLDHDEIFTMARAIKPEDQSSVLKVLELFFTREADGYHNERADEELAAAQSARDNGKKGGRPRKDQKTGGETPEVTGGKTEHETEKGGGQASGSGHPSTITQQPERSKALSGKPDVARVEVQGPKAKARAQARENAKAAIDYLNAKAGTKYHHTEANLKFAIDRQLIDKATLEDLKAVVDAKVAEAAKGAFDRKYLRPETLWNATKFGSYIGQVGTAALPAKVSTIVVAVDLKAGGRETIAEYTHPGGDYRDWWGCVIRTARNRQHRDKMLDIVVGAVVVYVTDQPGLKGRYSVAEVRDGWQKAA